MDVNSYQRRYRASPEGKAAMARYHAGEKRRAAQARYAASDGGRLARRRGAKAAVIRDPEKAAARHAVNYAVRTGRLIQGACAICGSTEKVNAHHANGYAPSHWLDVDWLCPVHHREAHRALRNQPEPTASASSPLSLKAAEATQQ